MSCSLKDCDLVMPVKFLVLRSCKESDTTERLHFHFSLLCIGEGNGTHSSILAWRIPWTEEPGGPQSTGRKESDTTEQTSLHFVEQGSGNYGWMGQSWSVVCFCK